MVEEIKELQEKELILLKELKRICEKNKITYFLAYGTLLGAVRHQGFIPWDDDIDVCMNYKDYLRFEQACKKDLHDPFFLQTRDTDPQAGLSYDKLRLSNTTLLIDYMTDRDMNHGINIDIYPIYNVADNRLMRKIQLLSAAIYMLLETQQAPENHGKGMRMVSQTVLFFFRGERRKRLKERCHRYMARYEDKNTQYKAMLFGNLMYCTHTYPAGVFEKAMNLKFEDDEFSVPTGYKEYLKSFYGDYMKMPPEEERGVKLDHILKIDTETPYKAYKGILYCRKTTRNTN